MRSVAGEQRTPIVYLAGLDGTGELLFKQAPGLARSYRVITFRSRDYGPFTYEDLADDLAAIIGEAGEKRAVILGESFGGTVALAFALRHPEMVERLVVVNSFPRFHKRIRINLAVWAARLVPFRLLWPFRFAASLLGLYADGVSREDRRRFFAAIRTVTKEGYTRRLELIREADLEARLSEIKSPALFIAGEKDLLVPSVKEARRMSARMPNANVKIIKGAGHACLMGSRVRLAEIIAEWVAAESARQC
jgi:3-oxoadipate enol-lactonase